MVGAAQSRTPHPRSSFSNYGARIDCYGWGDSIDTSGDGWMGSSTTAYTTGFGGTSGASPIVTGAALLMQSWRRAHAGKPYSPAELRRLLSDPRHNTPSANPSTDQIGAMPDLRALIQAEAYPQSRYLGRWRSLIYILFGVIQDGNGVVLGPRGPEPVDPSGPMTHLRPQKRDMLVALAATELAELLDDETDRSRLNAQGVEVLRHAVERLAGKHRM